MEGKCFDCGRVVPRIHKHHPNRPSPETINLCPSCHSQRHHAHTGLIPITGYLSQEDKDKVLMLGHEEEKLELHKLDERYHSQWAKIQNKYKSKRVALIKKLLGDIPRYTLLNYPYPIWTLNFFSYQRPKETGNDN